MDQLLINQPEKRKIYICQHCDKECSRSDHLKTHIKNEHDPASMKLNFLCTICQKPFLHRSNWTTHLKRSHNQTDEQVKKIKNDGIPQRMLPNKKIAKRNTKNDPAKNAFDMAAQSFISPNKRWIQKATRDFSPPACNSTKRCLQEEWLTTLEPMPKSNPSESSAAVVMDTRTYSTTSTQTDSPINFVANISNEHYRYPYFLSQQASDAFQNVAYHPIIETSPFFSNSVGQNYVEVQPHGYYMVYQSD